MSYQTRVVTPSLQQTGPTIGVGTIAIQGGPDVDDLTGPTASACAQRLLKPGQQLHILCDTITVVFWECRPNGTISGPWWQ